jgi:hypothetical protein
MRVIVCGGRNYADKNHVFDVLTKFNIKYSFVLLIEGGATGADRLSRQWALENSINHITYDAQWKDFSDPCIKGHGRYGEYNKLAGSKRNQKMLDEGKPDLVLAFPGGTGTADMVRRAQKAGVPVIKFTAPVVERNTHQT